MRLTRNHTLLTLSLLALVALTGCSERDLTELEVVEGGAENPDVFIDGFSSNLDFAAFDEFNSYLEAISIDQTGGVDNSTALRFTIPAGRWTGGWFYTTAPRDLSAYNALVFDVKANQSLNLSAVGFGIGAETNYQAEVNDTPLTTAWSEVVIPVPNPDRMILADGMFWLSQADNATEQDIWFDNVRYASRSDISNVRPVMNSATVTALKGETVPISGTSTTYSINGADVTVGHGPAFFDYITSDPAIITSEGGELTAVGSGSATVTAMLGGVPVDGEVSVTVVGPPTNPAPTPTLPEADVISIFSDAYTSITVDTWRTQYSSPEVAQFDQDIEGNAMVAYTGLTNNAYVIVDFVVEQIDAATPEMTHFSIDVFAPTGTFLALKLVDFGPDGVYGGPGSDDTERELFFTPLSDPAFTAGDWVTLDIPLTSFTGMNFNNVSELVLKSANIGNLWIDNLYFHK